MTNTLSIAVISYLGSVRYEYLKNEEKKKAVREIFPARKPDWEDDYEDL